MQRNCVAQCQAMAMKSDGNEWTLCDSHHWWQEGLHDTGRYIEFTQDSFFTPALMLMGLAKRLHETGRDIEFAQDSFFAGGEDDGSSHIEGNDAFHYHLRNSSFQRPHRRSKWGQGHWARHPTLQPKSWARAEGKEGSLSFSPSSSPMPKEGAPMPSTQKKGPGGATLGIYILPHLLLRLLSLSLSLSLRWWQWSRSIAALQLY